MEKNLLCNIELVIVIGCMQGGVFLGGEGVGVSFLFQEGLGQF